jgi:hypothetical protein
MAKTQIHKTVYEVVVLSEDRLEDGIALADIAYQIDEGDWIGSVAVTNRMVVQGRKMIQSELEAIGNDGSFFNLGR